MRLSRRPVHARPGSRRRLISPHPKHPLGCLDLVTGTPPGNEGARQRGIEEVNRHRVVENPAHPRRRYGPSVSAAVLVQPSGYLGITLAKTAGRNADPDADWEAPIGERDQVARSTTFVLNAHGR